MRKGLHENLVGNHYSYLTVIKQEGFAKVKNAKYKDGYALLPLWKCKCSCGKECIVRGADLKSGRTKSCGCLKSSTLKKIGQDNKKYNVYDLTGDYGVGYTNEGTKFIFDLEDYEKIKSFCWHDNKGYIETKDSSRRIIRLHQLVTDYQFNIVDHINRNPMDNRKNNLREANYSTNAMNASLSKNNTSGIKGVSWSKKSQKWCAYIGLNKKTIWLGQYELKEDAVKARLEAEVKYFGEFAPQKHLFKQYKIGG